MPRINVSKVNLSNGLDVLVHRQDRVPLVALNLWYHVGSKNEERRQRGFAHLFEHLMFEGSEHFPGDFFKPLQRLGAGINGSTSPDRTNYYVDLPPAHLELAVAMESDRMANLLPALTDQKLRVQKDVVKNEYRQNYANRPYGQVGRILAEALYPPGHPYSWLTIGVMEDVEAATRDDVESFFRRFYVPSNASLCLAGDIDIADAHALAERYFGSIPGGTHAARPWTPNQPLLASKEIVLRERVELDRLYQSWPTVPMFADDDAELSLLADVLAHGRASRLYRRLVLEDEVAQSVSCYQSGRELAGVFGVVVTLRPRTDLGRAREVIRTEIMDLAEKGPTVEELERARNNRVASFLFGLDSVGGFGGVADRLNAYNVYLGEPGRITSDLDRFLRATVEGIARAAQIHLRDGAQVTLTVRGCARVTCPLTLDRTIRPVSGSAPRYLSPMPEVIPLSNGGSLWIAPRRELPIVAASVLVAAGASAHGPSRAGLASLTSAMLDEGTTTRTARQLAAAVEQVGSTLSTSCGWEGSFVNVHCLATHGPRTMEIAVDILLNPTFPADEWSRIRAQSLTGLKAGQDNAENLAQRALLRAIFPSHHPYHIPIDGHESTVAAIETDDLAQFHRAFYRPKRTAWIVAGDIERNAIADQLERLMEAWPLGEEVIAPAIEAPARLHGAKLVLVHRPGAPQAVVRVGHLGIARNDADFDVLLLWNQILGGQFASRLNETLREAKGYTYGIRSHFDARTSAGPFWIGAALQTDRLAQALDDLRIEVSAILAEQPPTAQELDDARRSLIEGQARHFETPSALVARFASLFLFGLPIDHHAQLPERLGRITVEQLLDSSRRHIHPESFVFVVSADAEIVAQPLRQVGWAELEIIEDSSVL